jgi:hypothetical protein
VALLPITLLSLFSNSAERLLHKETRKTYKSDSPGENIEIPHPKAGSKSPKKWVRPSWSGSFSINFFKIVAKGTHVRLVKDPPTPLSGC